MPEVKPASAPNYATQMSWASPISLAAGTGLNASTTLYLGTAHEAGLRLRSITVTAIPGVVISASSYFFFRPFVAYTIDGAATKRYLSAGRGTNASGLTADIPLRIHEEEFLNERLGKGWRVGVDISTVSAGAGSPSATFANFNASVVRYAG